MRKVESADIDNSNDHAFPVTMDLPEAGAAHIARQRHGESVSRQQPADQASATQAVHESYVRVLRKLTEGGNRNSCRDEISPDKYVTYYRWSFRPARIFPDHLPQRA